MSTPRTPKNVHAAIAAVMRDVGAVGKRGRNDDAGYSFRRIEDVMDALNPVMAKHGVHVTPRVRSRLTRDRHSETPNNVQHVALHVEFRIYGPAGDHVKITTWGEGIDAGDKATSKAHTAALKNGLLPAFMIPTHNLTVDGDAAPAVPPTAPAGLGATPVLPPPGAPRRISQPQIIHINADVRRLGSEGSERVRAVLLQRGYSEDATVRIDDLTYEDAEELLVALARPQTDDGAEAAPAADVSPADAAAGSPASVPSAPSSPSSPDSEATS